MITVVSGADTTAAATTTYGYDADGNLTSVTDPLNRVTSHAYNSRHFRTSTTNALNQVTTFGYDAVGRVTLTTFPDTRTEGRSYDAAGQLVSMTDPLNETTSYGYDGEGRMTALTTPRGHTRQWFYDAAGRLFRRSHPDGTYEQFTYFADHQLALHRVPSGVTATYTYTTAGRLAGRDWSDTTADVSFSWDALGRLVAAVNAESSVSLTYDVLSRKVTETQLITGFGGPGRTVSYGYDPDGFVATVTYPDGHVVEYSHTARGQMQAVTAGGPPPLAQYSYNAGGERTGLTLENGLTTNSTFNAAGRLLSHSHTVGGSAHDSVSYTLDSMGRRTGMVRPGMNSLYGYDAAGQLTTASHFNTPGPASESFAYDGIGNRMSSTGVVDASYTANSLEQYSAVNGQSQSHDVNGNLLLLAQPNVPSVEFEWDSENRMRAQTRAGGVPAGMARIVNVYDALHRRIAKQVFQGATSGSGVWNLVKTVTFVYDGWNVIEERELTPSGAVSAAYRYTWGADVSGTRDGAGGVGGLILAEELGVGVPSNSPVAHYYYYDGNGNVIGVTDSTGWGLDVTYRYTAFGAMAEANGSGSSWGNRNPWKFSTKYHDEEVEGLTGTYYYGYRHYLPGVGRWASRDPIGEKGGVNLYEMVGNHATNVIDYLGREEMTPEACLEELGVPSQHHDAIKGSGCSGLTACQLKGKPKSPKLPEDYPDVECYKNQNAAEKAGEKKCGKNCYTLFQKQGEYANGEPTADENGRIPNNAVGGAGGPGNYDYQVRPAGNGNWYGMNGGLNADNAGGRAQTCSKNSGPKLYDDFPDVMFCYQCTKSTS